MLKKFFVLINLFQLISFKAYGAEEGMPQLNPEFWTAQIFWLVLIFSALYIATWKIFLPKITASIENRKSKIVNDLQLVPQIAQNILGDEVIVVSAFQNISAELLQNDANIDCDVLVAGDLVDARNTVIGLASDAGLTGWHAGPLCNSVAAEALTSILIAINKKHSLAHSGIKITGH